MSVTVTFDSKDAKKHSNRWDAEDKDSVVSSIYIRKGVSPELDAAKRVRIIIEVVE